MPPTQRRNATGVIHQLLQEPQQFNFFQAVRLLDRWLDKGTPGGRGLTRLNFRNSLSLSFPASEIESVKVHFRQDPGSSADEALAVRASDIDRVDLTPAFMGLLGVTGTMPLFYTEALAQRELYQKDFGARAFMDIFSHRAVAMFYDAWRKHRLPLQYEANQTHAFLPLTLSVAGMSHARQQGRGKEGRQRAIAPEALAYYAGAIQQRTWSVAQAQAVLQDYFRVPVRIEQFIGRWYQLPESGRAYLGIVNPLNGSQGVLGHSAMLGDRVWQRDLCMRVVLGPLPHEQMQRFLPGSKGAQALQEWLTLCFGSGLEFEINLALQHSHVRGLQLDSSRSPQTSRLGWDTFLQTRPSDEDRVDVRYDLQAVA
ncbi:MAG: type VI secretion system baseplate subunit TssG [Acidobacteriota bacterium]